MLVDRWMGLLGVGALLLGVAACGGSVVTGTSDGGASGGSSSTGGASSTGGSGGTAPTCDNTRDCCQKACLMIAGKLSCTGSTQDCSCQLDGLPPVCLERLDQLYRCVLQAGVKAFTCNASGQLAPRCGVCDAQLNLVEQACGGGTLACVQ